MGLIPLTYLKQNFNVQEAADLYQAVHLGTLEDLSASLRSESLPMSTPWMPSLQFIFSLSQGICRTSSPLTQWIEAVRWHGDTKIAAIIHTDAEWADAKTLLATLENVVVEAESKHGAVVWSSAQNDPPTIPTDSFPLQAHCVNWE